jgi:anti-anti-sigma regulatory factor
MFEWRFDQSFRLTITRDAGVARVVFVGDLDAVTAKNLEQRARLPELPGSEVVLDLSGIDAIDTAGAREIRRIEALYESCELRGARPDLRELLDLMPRTA